MDETYDANIRVRALPRYANTILDALAVVRGIAKWEIVQAALVEFAENHKQEVENAIRRQTSR